jgi:diadenosine tetraphosphate (Ap4A) HIT family hydrolase
MQSVCPFCADQTIKRARANLRTVFAINDQYPVTAGHMLILPRRHTNDYFTMTQDERRDAEDLLINLRRDIVEADPTVIGFNIGMNCGSAAGQTIEHAHIHLIPRRSGDTPDPRGGVRGVLPERMHYGGSSL